MVDFAIAGNKPAFEVLMRRYRNLMRSQAIRTLSSNAEVDDVVQDAFITAWEKLSTVNDGAQVKAWLMRVVANRAIDRLRRGGPRPVELNDNTPIRVDSGPFNVVATLLQNEALTSAVTQLPPQQRQAWLLREFSGSSYSVIAEELGVPVSTVRGLLARSRRTLASELAAWR